MHTSLTRTIKGLNTRTLSSSNSETNIYEETGIREDRNRSLTETNETIRILDNVLYVDNNTSSTRTQHDYESIDTLESNIHENREPERNFVNPIYGDDSVNGSTVTTSSQRQQERSTQYDQLGHIYYTLENEQDREERYALRAQLQVQGEGDGTKREQSHKRADHSYEDVQ